MKGPLLTAPLFDLGRTIASSGALAAMEEQNIDPSRLFSMHASGDFGDVSAKDLDDNILAMEHGGLIISVYQLGSAGLYVITEADRSSTCICLAKEY